MMNPKIDAIIKDLEANAQDDNFVFIATNLMEDLATIDGNFEAISPLIDFIARNPRTDFGMPGPLVHFLEKFFHQGYEDALAESVIKMPTIHTVWMLNRIINGSSAKDKQKYLKILHGIMDRNDIPSDVKGAVEDLL